MSQLESAPQQSHSGYFVAHSFLMAACMLGGYLAFLHGRPVTAALALVFAVVMFAARYGLRLGLGAALLTSLAYNLFLSAPVLRFSLQSIDDLVPLLAFNVSAIASAYVAGRLRDEARDSHEARSQVASLLAFSQALQKSTNLQEMLGLALHAGEDDMPLQIRLDDGRVFSMPKYLGADFGGNCRHEKGRSPSSRRVRITEEINGGTIIALTGRNRMSNSAARLAVFGLAIERWLLTERLVEADVIRRSEDFKTTLLSSVSHDLRTPLAVIAASAGSLLRYRKSLPDEVQHELLETVEQQAARLNCLTNNLLNLGRIEGGLQTHQMPEVDALEVLGSALVAIRQIAPERVITKNLALPMAEVRADPSLLEQVFFNILDNAIAHTPANAAISVSASSVQDALLVSVEDEGPGLRQEDTPRIFERFYQGETGAGRQRGSGLGLAIAQGFARSIGGDVTASQRTDGRRGARFEVRLPLTRPEIS